MKKVLFTVALGAMILSTQAGAQSTGAPGVQPPPEASGQHAVQMADEMFQRFDLNHDGVITRDEANQALAQLASGQSGKPSRRTERMIERMFANTQTVTEPQLEAMALAQVDRRANRNRASDDSDQTIVSY
jgi:hypothetical protein